MLWGVWLEVFHGAILEVPMDKIFLVVLTILMIAVVYNEAVFLGLMVRRG